MISLVTHIICHIDCGGFQKDRKVTRPSLVSHVLIVIPESAQSSTNYLLFQLT